VTSGDDVVNVGRYLRPDESRYSARDVVEAILAI
jgi:hypothetical protein